MPTMVTIARGTTTYNTENVRVRDVSPDLAELEPDEGPITSFLMQMNNGKKRVTNAEFEWVEDELNPRFDTLAADLTSGASSMTVNNFSYFRSGDLVKINNKEVVQVTAAPTTSTVTITRSVGSTAGLAASINQTLHILSSSHAENAAGRDLLTTQKSVQNNYCQIFRDPFALSTTAEDSNTYGGNDWAYQKRKFLLQHKRSIDQAFVHGEANEDTSAAQRQHQVGGVLEFITTNVKDANGELSELEFEDFVRVVNRYGRNHVFLCSPKGIQAVNAFARGKLQTRTEDKKYGVNITKYENAGRNVSLVEHKQLSNDLNLSDFTGIGGYIIALDMSELEMCYMGSQVTRYRENIQTPDVDGREDEYRSQVGLRVMQERKHGLLEGIT